MEDRELWNAGLKSPERFLGLLRSELKSGQEFSDLVISRLILRLLKENPASALKTWLPRIFKLLAEARGWQGAENIFSRAEVSLGVRKPRLGLYDHALHYIGGAQKYGCTIAHALQNDFDITLIANKTVRLEELQNWYNLDLSRCSVKIIKIPFFDETLKKDVIDPGVVDLKKDNPFHGMSRESGNYDLFVNNSTLEMVFPLANISIMVVHFPERKRSRFFYGDEYTEIVYNSRYTAEWIKERWDIIPHRHIYPPVDMQTSAQVGPKENLILSVSRFDPGGNKQQIEMIRLFEKLTAEFAEETRGWKLVLVGGSVGENPYLERIKKIIAHLPTGKVILKVNIPVEELRAVYAEAKLFWHLAGLDQTDPARVEHFGMTIAEAMQNGCVPLVFKGGGQAEIVEDQVSGILFSSQKELIDQTIELIRQPALQSRLSQGAFERGKRFHKDVFVAEVKSYFSRLLEGYRVSP